MVLKILNHIFKGVVGDGKFKETYTDLVLFSTCRIIVLKAIFVAIDSLLRVQSEKRL
jgi:hypothetical protein